MGQDHSDVVPAAAQDGMEGVAQRALEGEATVGLHVPYRRLNRAEAAQVAPERQRHAAALAGDEDLGRLHAMAPIDAVDEGSLWRRVGQNLHLLERLAQGVAVVGITGERAHTDDEASLCVVANEILEPNSYRTRALPLEMQSASGSCDRA